MGFIEHIRVSKKRAEAGFGAEVDCAAAILCTREIRRVGVAKNPPAEGDEARMLLLIGRD